MNNDKLIYKELVFNHGYDGDGRATWQDRDVVLETWRYELTGLYRMLRDPDIKFEQRVGVGIGNLAAVRRLELPK